MNPTLLPSEQDFIFDASFESSNLDCVVKIKDR